jgi:hypothetical protein
MVQVLGHMGIDGNETTDELARQGSSNPLTGPEPVLGISPKVARGVIKDWSSKTHAKHWQSTCAQRQAMGFC